VTSLIVTADDFGLAREVDEAGTSGLGRITAS
jgi:predicted glycoside hydrolase/deacetylase ChbG (UPF0249 family)